MKAKQQQCTLKQNDVQWKIQPSDLNDKCREQEISIHDALFKDVEYAGDFLLQREEYGGTCTKKEGCNVVKFNSMNKGNNYSVKTKDGYCNFHTHPLSCYMGEKTIWGWPSGEDMRETIRFMMYGNVIHLIFTIEGIYTVQVNPNYISTLRSKKLQNKERGLLVSLIETYFKSTHGFRNIEYNHKKCKKERNQRAICFPKDWVTFANNFRLNNIISQSNKCTKNLSCAGMPNYDTVSGNITMEEYLENYEIDYYTMDPTGKIKNGTKKNSNTVMNSLKQHISVFDKTYHDIEGWERGQWFKVSFYENKFKGKGIITSYKSLHTVQGMEDMLNHIRKNPKSLSFPSKPIQFSFKDVSTLGSCVVGFRKK